MREQVLEIAKYPEIVFVSSNISVTRLAEGRYRARIIGDPQPIFGPSITASASDPTVTMNSS